MFLYLLIEKDEHPPIRMWHSCHPNLLPVSEGRLMRLKDEALLVTTPELSYPHALRWDYYLGFGHIMGSVNLKF